MKSHRETLDLSIDSTPMANFLFPGRQLCSVNELRGALDSCKAGEEAAELAIKIMRRQMSTWYI